VPINIHGRLAKRRKRKEELERKTNECRN